MTASTSPYRFLRIAAWSAISVVCIGLIGAISIFVSGWLLAGVEKANGERQNAAERSVMGDYFGGVSALFSGIALLLLIATLLLQQRELKLQRQELSLQRLELIESRKELRRSAEADLRSLHVQITQMAMADPNLAQIWNDYPNESAEVVRQHLFSNLTYSHYLLFYKWETSTDAEVLEYAHSLIQSPMFRRYWEASRHGKVNLSPESAEGKLFRLFEQAIRNEN